MASGTPKKSAQKKGTPSKLVKTTRKSVVSSKGAPWGTIVAVVAVVALLATVLVYYYVQSADKRAQKSREEAAASFTPSAQNPDPSLKIPGVITRTYTGSVHILPTERVAYDQSPPFGGPHDGFWAACNGIVYPNAVRNENMVHSLEHGTVWIAYNPQEITGDALKELKLRVEGKTYTMMSPYPGLDKPISLQSWGHQLKVDSASDERIDDFITALRQNPNKVYPELGASCDALGPGQFDPDNPPPFDPTQPGPDAKPMTYNGSEGAQPDAAGGASSTPTTAPTSPPASSTKSSSAKSSTKAPAGG